MVTRKERAAWLFSYTQESLEISISAGLLGASERYRNTMSRMGPGDLALVYVSKPPYALARKVERRAGAFRAIFEITGSTFVDESVLWPTAKRLFPYRVPVRLEQRVDVPVQSVLFELEFVPNKRRYGFSFLTTPRSIPIRDVERIVAADHAARYGVARKGSLA